MVGRKIRRVLDEIGIRWGLVLTTTLLLAACTTAPVQPSPTLTPLPTADTTHPPEIDFATATTFPDGRPFTETRFAGVQLTSAGEIRLFDDIGRMATQHLVSSQEIAASWVRDYEQDTWIPVSEAVFVGSGNLVTPRGSGLLAVDSAERALLLARELNGRTLAYHELALYMAEGLADAPLPSSGGPGLGGLLEVDR